MVLTGIILLILINRQNEILMKVLSYISVMTIVLLLVSLYAIIWIIILHKENSYLKWKDISFVANLGFIFALGQIIVLDLLRYTLTGSWVNIIK